MNKSEIQELKSHYSDWFSDYSWQWFTTQKIIAGRPSRRHAIEQFDNWIEQLERAEGSSRFRWVRVLERGTDGNHFHFHTVIGGFRNRMTYWGKRWDKLGGEAQIARYDPDQGGIRYLLKTMNSKGDLDLDFQLPEHKEGVGKSSLLEGTRWKTL